MKIDRLLEIIIYLLNHEKASARSLADRFNVSVRTIQRDMESISIAGVPVYSLCGKSGGYAILPEYKINSQSMKMEEYDIVLSALKSLATSYTNNSLDSLIDKYNVLAERQDTQCVFWDFSVTKENQDVQMLNDRLKNAIESKKVIKFKYRSANGNITFRTVQPLAIHYKWYAWYLFNYSFDSNEYRTCKVARIQDLLITDEVSNIKHDDVDLLMKRSEQEYYSTCIHIEIHFYRESIELMKEYFPDCPLELVQGDEYRLFLDVPAKERLWKALLLSFGNKAWVTAPKDYAKELVKTAQDFLSNYDTLLS